MNTTSYILVKFLGFIEKGKKKTRFSPREKNKQDIYKGKKILLSSYVSKAAYEQHEKNRNIYTLKERKFEASVLYPANVTFKSKNHIQNNCY